MKKILAMLLALSLASAFTACGDDTNNGEDTTVADDTTVAEETTVAEDTTVEDEAVASVMTYDEYMAAAIDDEVVIDAYVQATQSWWDNKITVYAQDEDGAYFIYEMACSEEDSAKLVPGTAIKVTGYKGAWEGEIEIMDATFEFAGEETFIADPIDLTDKLGTDELINYQNYLAAFNGMVVEKVEYKNGEPGDDIYVDLSFNGNTYNFCIERYLTAPDTDVYAAVGALEVGDIVNVEGFVYWYNGINTHITAVTVADEF